jgi:hypothetical protein
MPEHPLAPTTHTLEMAQAAELSKHLATPSAHSITAADLGVDGGRVPSAGVLTRVWLEGSPEFPYLYGDFSGVPGSDGAPIRVPLHTEALRRLSQWFGLHHRWGV